METSSGIVRAIYYEINGMTSVRLSLYALVFVFFFGGSLVEYELFPEIINSYSPEILVIYLFVYSITNAQKYGIRYVFPFIGPALLLTLWSVVSSLALHTSMVDMVLMLRLLLRFYILFVAIANLNLSDSNIYHYIRIVAILFVLQIPVSIIKVMIYGQGEAAIGTYATHGGGSSASIPMIAVGFVLTYIFVYKRTFWSWILILGYITFGIVGGKKATFVTVPLIIMFALINIITLNTRYVRLYWIPICVLIGVFVGYVGIRCLPKLNPDGAVWGRFDLDYLISYSVDYSTSSVDGVATSRGSTWLKSLEHVNQDWESMLFGLGPGCVMKSRFEGVGREVSFGEYGIRSHGAVESLNILYGLNGVCWMLLQVGYVGTAIWFLFYIRLFLWLRRSARDELDPFWIAFNLGMVCFSFTILFISVSYGSYMIMGALEPFVYFMFLGLYYAHKRNAELSISS